MNSDFMKVFYYCFCSCEVVEKVFGLLSVEYVYEFYKFLQLLFNDRQVKKVFFIIDKVIGFLLCYYGWSNLDVKELSEMKCYFIVVGGYFRNNSM